jgi:hypothetical protein
MGSLIGLFTIKPHIIFRVDLGALTFFCTVVFPYGRRYSRTVERIFMKSESGKFYWSALAESSFGKHRTTVAGTSHAFLRPRITGWGFYHPGPFTKVKGQILANASDLLHDMTC